jgi:DivIVA domain-containing protein
MHEDEPLGEGRDTTESRPGGPPPPPPPGIEDLRDDVPKELRDVSFPFAMRGYDRRAVDAYVKRVNTAIAELEVSRSPQAAVRHALDRVGEQTSGILQRARETAEEITTSARAEGDEISARAKAEAEEVISRAGSEADMTTARAKANAEETTSAARTEADEMLARARADAEAQRQQVQDQVDALRQAAEERVAELDADARAIWQRRAELLEEIQRLMERLDEVVSAARARSSDLHASGPEADETRRGEQAVSAAAVNAGERPAAPDGQADQP